MSNHPESNNLPSDSTSNGSENINSSNTPLEDTDQLLVEIKNKKSLLNKLITAKRRYDKAVKNYRAARKEYAKAKLEAEPLEKLSIIHRAYQKAASVKAKRKEKFEELERLVQFYFSNRSRQLG